MAVPIIPIVKKIGTAVLSNKAKKIIEQAEAIREENKVYADALEEAKGGEYSRNKSKLKQQAIAAVAENADLKKRLNKSMSETLE